MFRLRASNFTQKGSRSFLFKCFADLKISLSGQAMFRRGLYRTETFAFTFNEHGKLARNLVILHES